MVGYKLSSASSQKTRNTLCVRNTQRHRPSLQPTADSKTVHNMSRGGHWVMKWCEGWAPADSIVLWSDVKGEHQETALRYEVMWRVSTREQHCVMKWC